MTDSIIIEQTVNKTVEVTTSTSLQTLEVVAQGPEGPQGEVGEGVSSGGTIGQVLVKSSSTDYDTEWSNSAPLAVNVTGIVAVVNGGTGADDVIEARSNLSAAKSGENSDITSMTGITGGVSSPDYVDFDISATVTRATGRLWWDNADGIQTLNLGMAGSNATMQVGQESYFRIKASYAITEGQVVMFTGTVGASGALRGAPASGLTASTAQYVMGVATEDIAHNSWGYVTEFGLVRGINTSGGAESWVDGQILYYNPSVAGGLTKTLPSAPNAKVVVAAVIYAHSTNGSLFIRPSFGGELGQYEGNVGFSSLSNNDLIKYDLASGKWTNSQLDLSSPPAIGETTPSTGKFTEVAITTATGESTLVENTSITGWLYSGTSFSISAQESTPLGLFFSPDGLKMYVNGSTGDDVNEYTLGTAWDITAATFVTVFSTSAQDSAPADLFFKPDGLTMFVLGSTNDTVYQYTLGTAWSVATASYASKSFSVTTQENAPQGLWFKPDGTTMYIVGTTNDTVYQYTLGTAWDISTASYASKSYSVSAQEGTPNQVNLNADGTKMWVVGQSGDDIWEYTLATAWDVSTATPVNNFYVGFQEATPSGMFIDSSAANRVFMLGSTSDAIYQYNTAANSLEIDTEKLYIDGRLSVNKDFVAGENAYVDGVLTVQGGLSGSTISASSTLTATSTLSLSGSTGGTASFATSVTTANTSINTAQTSGTFTLGGTSGTGTITLGRSTVSQTTDFQAGATASGSTKAINIGTAGLSGSTTNIAIGSAVSGATSSTTLNGLVVNSISAAVSAAGSTQGAATALVSNINNVTVVAAAADGVRLPTAVAGIRILVRNSDAADTLKIYPATGSQINALGSNAAYSLTAGSTIELMATTATQWYTF